MRKRIFAAVFLTSLMGLIFACVSALLLFEVVISADAREQLKAFTSDLASGLYRSQAEQGLLGRKFGNVRVTLIHPDGQVFYDSFQSAESLENHAHREEVVAALRFGSGSSERYSSSLAVRTIYEAFRLPNGDILRCAITSETVLRLVWRLSYVMLLMALLSALCSAYIARLLTEKIVRPINQLDLNAPQAEAVYEELSPLISKILMQQEQISAQIAALKQQSEEFLTITESMTEGLILLNPEVEIVSINRSARAFLQVKEDCVGQSLLTVDRSSFAREFFSHAGNLEFQKREIERGGSYYLVFFNRIVAAGKFRGYALLLVDISASKLSERQREEFTANVSHELKTPLQSIIGSAELLEQGIVKAEDIAGFASKIRQRSLRLLSLINDIIFLSRLDALTQGQEQSFRVAAVISDVFELLQDKAKDCQVSLRQEVCELEVYAVYQYVHELIFNLCDNALKYNRPGGKVLCRVTTEEQKLLLEVSDTGIGIRESDYQRIFERFYRGDLSHSQRIEGTGLGLSIVKKIVRLYQGELEVHSVEGQGSCFKVRLPLSSLSKQAGA